MFFSVSDNKKFYPLRMAEKDCQNTIDLFFYEQDGVSNYSLIKSFTRLVKSQITSSKNGSIYICKKCFNHFTKYKLLQNIFYIVQLMKQFLCACHLETRCYVLKITTNNFQFLLKFMLILNVLLNR